jgi:mRNA interferase RelE/StbE
VSNYTIRLTKEAEKDIKKLAPKLKNKLKNMLINVIANEPYSGKKLIGDLAGFFSLRLTYQDRIVYTIDEKHKVIYIHRAKTHYGD